jgi:hypothetical protein
LGKGWPLALLALQAARARATPTLLGAKPTRLKALFHQRFGDHLPLVRRQDVKGFLKRKPIWLELTLKPRKVLSTVMNMEAESRRFYQDAMNRVTSPDIRELLEDLAATEEDHQGLLVEQTREKKKTGALSAEQH